MKKFLIVETADFKKEFSKLPKEMRARFRKQFKRVEENPFAVGKTLGSRFFRELKNCGYRAYFVILEAKVMVLFVGTSGKKDQQDKIRGIRERIKRFGAASYLLGKIYKFGENDD
jgi:mRNA-degrading endonuclease RelE of RelBE toxin-antitoxin system